ncbi:MAG: AsmA-like C-terminal domain-containing protein [Geminicoccaceae bacterium]
MLRRILLVLLTLVVLLAAAVGGVLWRLTQGPLSLAWLQPTIEAMIARASPYTVTFTEPSLVWERQQELLGLQVKNLEARSPSGQLVAAAPQLRGELSLPALMSGEIRLVGAALDLPVIGLKRETDGRMALSFDGKLAEVPVAETSGGGGLGALLGGDPGATDPRLGMLHDVVIRAPRLDFTDVAAGTTATASDAEFQLVREGDVWTSSLSADVGKGRLLASAKPAGSGVEQAVTFELTDVLLSDLSAVAPNAGIGGLAVPVSGTVGFTIDPDTGERGAATVVLDANGGQLAAPDLGLAPVAVTRATVRATLEAGWQAVTIQQFDLAGDGFGVGLTGNAGLQDGDLRLDLTLKADDLDVAEILRLWPTTQATGARDWIAANLTAGKVTGASVKLGEGPSRPGQLDLEGSFGFTGATVLYLDGFPPAQGVDGTGSLAGDTLALQTTGGTSGAIRLGKGQVSLSNLTGAGLSQLNVRLDVASSVTDALRLLDREPIGFSKASGLPVDWATGDQATTVTVSLPIVDPLPKARIEYRAQSTLTKLAIPRLQPDLAYRVAADSVKLAVDPRTVRVDGDVRVNDVPLNLAFQQNLVPVKNVDRRIVARGRADAAGVRALGFTWPDGLKGAAGYEAVVIDGRSPKRTVDVDLELKELAIDVPALKMRKSAGIGGVASLILTEQDDGLMVVDHALLDMPAWKVEGSGALRLDPLRPERIVLKQLRAPLGDLTADLALQRNVWTGRIDIGTLDLRPLRESGDTGGGTTTIPDMALQLSAARLQLGETPLSRLSGSVERRGGVWRSADLKASIQDSTLSVDLKPGDKGGRLNVRGSDAGWVMRAFGTSDNGIRGGNLTVKADLMATGAAEGELKVRDFTLWGAPTIARIISLASFSGLGSALRGDGVPVRRLVVPFSYRNDVITVTGGRLVGSDIGARADGTVDLARQRLNITGTVAPAYTLNRILGSIPILGSLMSGSRSDAALAATFSVTGPLGAPAVSVNPLAALVPGAIRDLFTVPPETD